MTARSDANVIFRVGGVGEEGFDNEGAEGSCDGFDLGNNDKSTWRTTIRSDKIVKMLYGD